MSLRTAGQVHRRLAFEWLTNSDVTRQMMGPTFYPEVPIPGWDEFASDYSAPFFSGQEDPGGTCYLIVVESRNAGIVCHNEVDSAKKRVELDIWMKAQSFCGHGYGPDAIKTLCGHLHGIYGIRECLLRPSARNSRALRAYEKAGFSRVAISHEQEVAQYGEGDYSDDVVFIKRAG